MRGTQWENNSNNPKEPSYVSRYGSKKVQRFITSQIDQAKDEARREVLKEIVVLVDEQAEDEGLWFNAEQASEAHLQQELRKLHAVIEEANIKQL